MAAGVVVAVMVGGVLALRPTPAKSVATLTRAPKTDVSSADKDPFASSSGASATVQELASGGAPLEVTMANGAQLSLEPHTRVRAHAPAGPRLELELEVGAIRVRHPMALTDAAPRVSTPAYALVARSSDFLVGYWADRSFIDVRAGEIRVDGGSFGAGTVIAAGERREVRAQASPAKSAAQAAPHSCRLAGSALGRASARVGRALCIARS